MYKDNDFTKQTSIRRQQTWIYKAWVQLVLTVNFSRLRFSTGFENNAIVRSYFEKF